MTRYLRRFLSYPLLARELSERAVRKRTYWMRVIYGLLLYGLFLYSLRSTLLLAARSTQGSYAYDLSGVLGIGRSLFTSLLTFQCWGLFLFQPALMAGGITYEKERDSLTLLLLTGLSPGKVLLEKFLAGLLPMATLILLALPLGAVSFSYGGISTPLLLAGAIVLFAAWMQVGAFAILCSARFRTTTSALIATYLGGALIYLFLPVCLSVFDAGSFHWAYARRGDQASWAWALYPPEILSRIFGVDRNGIPISDTKLIALALRLCLPVLISTAGCLILARVMLVRHLDHVSNPHSIWARISNWWKRRWSKGAITHDQLPGDEPVAWREASRGWLAAREQQVYAIAIASTLLAAACLIAMSQGFGSGHPQRLNHLAVFAGTTTLLLLCMRAANGIVSERVSQTLDVLLTTSISAGEIVRQKARPVLKFGWLLVIFMTVIYGFQTYSKFQYVYTEDWPLGFLQNLLIPLITTLLYVPLVIWISLWFGLWMRTRFQVIVTSFGILIMWFTLPYLALLMMDPGETSYYYWSGRAQNLLTLSWPWLLSPGSLLIANAQAGVDRYGGYEHFTSDGAVSGTLLLWATLNLVVYGALIWFVRKMCLRHADRWLRR